MRKTLWLVIMIVTAILATPAFLFVGLMWLILTLCSAIRFGDWGFVSDCFDDMKEKLMDAYYDLANIYESI